MCHPFRVDRMLIGDASGGLADSTPQLLCANPGGLGEQYATALTSLGLSRQTVSTMLARINCGGAPDRGYWLPNPAVWVRQPEGLADSSRRSERSGDLRDQAQKPVHPGGVT